MERQALLWSWQALGCRISQVAEHMSEQANPQAAERGEEWLVRLWAFALLCRTTNNFAGMKLLLKKGLIVEARTLVRCCYENLFRISYLNVQRYEAVKVWISDDDKHTEVVGSDLQAWSKRQQTRVDADEFDKFMDKLRSKGSKKAGGFEAQASVGYASGEDH